LYLKHFATDEMYSETCHLSVSPSATAADVICRALDAKNICDDQQWYQLIPIAKDGCELSTGMQLLKKLK